MASPQKENGYTAIANELMEALCRTRINGEAMQIFMAILRKTYGYNKKADTIALSQFTEITGLKKQAAYKGIHKLLVLGIVTQKDYRGSKEYSVVKDYSKWKPLPKKTTVTQKGTAVTQKAYKSNPKRVIQKQKVDITKAIRRGPPKAVREYDPLGAEIIKAFETVDPKNKQYYGNTTQRAACDFLLKEYGLEEVIKRIGVLPKTNKIAYFPSIFTPVQLRDKWVQLQDAVDRKRGEVQNKKVKIV